MTANDSIQEALGRVNGAEGDVLVDLSAVRRVEPNVLRAMEELARISEGKSVRVVLGGVSVEVYKVLKLAKLASRFEFSE